MFPAIMKPEFRDVRPSVRRKKATNDIPSSTMTSCNFSHPARIRMRTDVRIPWLRVRVMERIFVHGQITSQNHGASIRPWNEYRHRRMGRVFGRGMKRLSETCVEHSSVEEYYPFDELVSRIFVKSVRIRAGCCKFITGQRKFLAIF